MKIVPWRHSLHASVIDFCSCTDGPHRFPQKGRLLSLRLRQSHTDFRTADGKWDSRESRTGTEIQKGFYVFGEMLGCKGTLHKMSTDDLCRFSNRGQVQTRVPAREQFEVCSELLVAACRQFAIPASEKAPSIS